MKVAIEIPEYDFERIKEYYDALPEDSTVDAETFYIANGKPLSEVVGEIKGEIHKILDMTKVVETDSQRAQIIALSWVLELLDKHIGGNE